MSPRTKTILVPFVLVDILFMAALAFWLIHQRHGGASAKPDIHVEIRHPESKLTEIDLVNNGGGSGPIAISVDVSWPDADLVEAKGLSQFTESDTGRRSLRFSLVPSVSSITLSPGQPSAIGWIKLTDDVPVRAEIASDTGTVTQP